MADAYSGKNDEQIRNWLGDLGNITANSCGLPFPFLLKKGVG